MNLHEYQAKQIFKDYGLPVPFGMVVNSKDEVAKVLPKISTEKYVVKAQVHAGGRGKAGGVKILSDTAAVEQFVAEILTTHLVTYQTTSAGQPVNSMLIEETCEYSKELYLGAVLDRTSQRVVIMASSEGGVDIEEIASKTPEKILKAEIHPMLGMLPYQCRELAFGLGLEGQQIKQFTKIAMGIGKMFTDKDLALLEINPLVITNDGNLLCLDGKINVDDNALYRLADIRQMWDPTQDDEREIIAKEWELNYIPLDGNIGCMVNGAGLAMATMDLIKLCGGEPANFLDVGGGATKERVKEAFKIILSSAEVKAVLINIFGGIVRCDLIAEGIIAAVDEVGITVPVVVRLEGNRAQLAAETLEKSKLNIIAAQSLQDAAEQVVAAAGGVK